MTNENLRLFYPGNYQYLLGGYWKIKYATTRYVDISQVNSQGNEIETLRSYRDVPVKFSTGHTYILISSNANETNGLLFPPSIEDLQTMVDKIPEMLQVYIQPSLPIEQNKSEPTKSELPTENISTDIYNKITADDNVKFDNTLKISPTITPIITSKPIQNSLELTNRNSLLLIFGLLTAAIIAIKINKKR